MGVLRVCCLRLFGHVLRLKGGRHRLAHPRIEIRQTHRLTAAQTSYAAKLQKKNQKIVILSQKTFPFLILTFPPSPPPSTARQPFWRWGGASAPPALAPPCACGLSLGGCLSVSSPPPRAAPASVCRGFVFGWSPPTPSLPPRVLWVCLRVVASPRRPCLRVLAVCLWVVLALIPNSPFPIPNWKEGLQLRPRSPFIALSSARAIARDASFTTGANDGKSLKSTIVRRSSAPSIA